MNQAFLLKHVPRHITKTIAPKTTLFFQDEKNSSVYFIVKGLVRIYLLSDSGEEITLSLRGKEELFGLYSLLLNTPPKSSAITLQESSIIMWNKKDFQKAIEKSPEFSSYLLTYLALQIRQENKYISRLATNDLESKTWKTLKRIAKLSDEPHASISHDTLARIVGATRPRITEILHKLEDNNKIKIQRGKIHIFL